MEQFKIVCFYAYFLQTLQCLMKQTTSQMYFWRIQIRLSCQTIFLKRKVSVKSVQSCTISKISTCIHIVGKILENIYCSIFAEKRQSSACFPKFSPVYMHVEIFEMVQDCTLFTLTFLLIHNVRQANIVCLR